MTRSTCYLSNDFSQVAGMFSIQTILAPEGLFNGEQIKEWVAKLKTVPKVFATNSIYLLREIELQEIPCDCINIVDGKFNPPCSISDLDNIEILERELKQSDIYLDQAK